MELEWSGGGEERGAQSEEPRPDQTRPALGFNSQSELELGVKEGSPALSSTARRGRDQARLRDERRGRGGGRWDHEMRPEERMR